MMEEETIRVSSGEGAEALIEKLRELSGKKKEDLYEAPRPLLFSSQHQELAARYAAYDKESDAITDDVADYAKKRRDEYLAMHKEFWDYAHNYLMEAELVGKEILEPSGKRPGLYFENGVLFIRDVKKK